MNKKQYEIIYDPDFQKMQNIGAILFELGFDPVEWEDYENPIYIPYIKKMGLYAERFNKKYPSRYVDETIREYGNSDNCSFYTMCKCDDGTWQVENLIVSY